MAIRLGDVFVALRADDSKLGSDLKKSKGVVASWAEGLQSNISAAVGGVVLAGVGALSTAVAGIGVAAFTAATGFDTATKKMTSQLGSTEAEAENLGKVLRDVFKNNFGDSIDDVSDSIVKVEKAFARIGGTQGTKGLQKATEAALALRDAFDVDVNETTGAAVELMDKFGLSSEQAFDFIARGFQDGLNASGDFLDTIGEYSTQFSNGGADAAQFFSILETGLQGGVLGTDKAADAFKEFRLRIQDGSKATETGLKLLGLSSAKLNEDLASGAITAADAFQKVLDALRRTDDPLIRMQAGAALIGTQFEDLGDTVVANLSLSEASLDEFTGSINKLNKQYETIPAFFEGLKRRAMVAIEPIGGFLLSSFNAALPGIEAMFTALEGIITAALARAQALFGLIKESGGGLPGAILAAAGALTGGKITIDTAAKVTSVNWGAFTHTYDAKSQIFSVDWTGGLLGGAGDFSYNALAKVLSIDWTSGVEGGVGFTYSTEAGVTSVDFGDYHYKYNAEAGVTSVDFGVFGYMYNATAGVTTVDFGIFGYTYNAKAKVGEIDPGTEQPVIVVTAKLGELIGFSLDTTGNIVLDSPMWSSFIDHLEWGQVIAFAGWNYFIDNLIWPTATKFFSWGTWLDVLTWPSNIAMFAWGGWLDVLTWPEAIGAFAWDLWLDVLTWPEAITGFLWDTWLDVLTWPGSLFLFSWKNFITGIDFTTWIPEFPGWAAIFRQLNPLGSGGGNGTTSDGSIGEEKPPPFTPTPDNPPLTPNGPEIILDPVERSLRRSMVYINQVNVTDRQDAEAMAYSIAQRLVYG